MGQPGIWTPDFLSYLPIFIILGEQNIFTQATAHKIRKQSPIANCVATESRI